MDSKVKNVSKYVYLAMNEICVLAVIFLRTKNYNYLLIIILKTLIIIYN